MHGVGRAHWGRRALISEEYGGTLRVGGGAVNSRVHLNIQKDSHASRHPAPSIPRLSAPKQISPPGARSATVSLLAHAARRRSALHCSHEPRASDNIQQRCIATRRAMTPRCIRTTMALCGCCKQGTAAPQRPPVAQCISPHQCNNRPKTSLTPVLYPPKDARCPTTLTTAMQIPTSSLPDQRLHQLQRLPYHNVITKCDPTPNAFHTPMFSQRSYIHL